MQPSHALQYRPVSGRESAIAAIAIALAFLLQILLSHPSRLFFTYPWIDEYFTTLIATDPSWHHAMQVLRTGIDGSPPLYHAILRRIYFLQPTNAAAEFRICSTVAAYLVLVFLYLTLRHAVSRSVAAVSLLAVWAHPLFVQYAFQARPYMLWMAGVAATTWALRLSWEKRPLILLIAAAFTCTIHYFGIITIYLLLAGELLLGPGQISKRFARILPAVLGSCALLFFLPIMHQQHQGMGKTWVDPPSAHTISDLFQQIMYAPTLLLLLIAWALNRLFRTRALAPADFSSLSGVIFLLFLPFLVVFYSVSRESLLNDRYCLPAILAIAGISAALALETPWLLRIGLAAIFFLAATFTINLHARSNQQTNQYYDQIASDAEAPGQQYLILFPTRHDLFELWFNHPELRTRLGMIDLRALDLPRDVAFEQRVHADTMTLYNFPPIVNIRALPPTPFRLIGTTPDVLEEFRQTVPLKQVDARLNIYEKAE